jgi:hypothetical protein
LQSFNFLAKFFVLYPKTSRCDVLLHNVNKDLQDVSTEIVLQKIFLNLTPKKTIKVDLASGIWAETKIAWEYNSYTSLPYFLLVLYDLLEYEHGVLAVGADESVGVGDECAHFSLSPLLPPLLQKILLLAPRELVQQEGRLVKDMSSILIIC